MEKPRIEKFGMEKYKKSLIVSKLSEEKKDILYLVLWQSHNHYLLKTKMINNYKLRPKSGDNCPLAPPDAHGYANSLKNYRPTRKEVHVVYLGLGGCFP